MIGELRRQIGAAVAKAVRELTGVELPDAAVEHPPRPEFGDLAVPVALELGPRLGRPPRQLAEELRDRLAGQALSAVRRWEVGGPGFLNVFLHRGQLLTRLLETLETGPPAPVGPKVLVEHTSINPNKAAHIGHLRNACLGDTLVRVLRGRGVPVEVHNYIDDTGVQVADVVVGLIELRGLDAAAVRALPEPFDYYCWDLYTEVTERLETDAALAARRRQVLAALERGTGPEAEVGAVVVDRIVRRHLGTMARLGIDYDLLVREGDVVALDLWSEAFAKLQATGQVYYAEEGRHAGCWVMRLEGVPGFEDLEEADKILVRSDGTTTYVAKDIAYHMWKYGLLPRTFRYEPFLARDGRVVWATTRSGGREMPFGGGARAITVIDVRQAYLQAIVAAALRAAGATEEARSFTHFAYEMVVLTPRTAAALGIPVSPAERGKPFVEMSGRRGHGVKADDLLDALEERAGREVAKRNPDLPEGERRQLARQIAAGAARYFLVKFTRSTVIAFDLDDALNFEGETGPYLQYAAVRAGSIFEKMERRWGVAEAAAVARLQGRGDGSPAGPPLPALDAAALAGVLEEPGQEELWGLILGLARFDEAVEQAAESLELSGLAKYAFTLAQQFNRFYHRYPILQEEDPLQRGVRILVAHAFRCRLGEALSLLGIPLPRRM